MLRNFPFFLISIMLFLQTGMVLAQNQITPEMMQIYQSMTPAERQQAMQILRGGGLNLDSIGAIGGEQRIQEQPMLEAAPVIVDESVDNLDGNLVIRGSDTIVVMSKLKEDAEENVALEMMADINRSRIIGKRLFQLDKRGILELPGIASVPLAGLTAEQVAIRLESEPLLSALDIEVTILPLTPLGTAALEPFGYSLFGEQHAGAGLKLGTDYRQSVFGEQSLTYMPVPRDYVLGPGDSIHIQLYGNENEFVVLTVQRDGMINFPRLGPRPVAGLTFGELRNEIKQWVADKLIGTEVSVSMGQLRSIRIFVVGDVKIPGGYTVSGLARMTNALFLAGGVTKNGSLRTVQLRRDGKTIGTLDLYQLLLKGDTRNDLQLRANDVVFVPAARNMAAVDGEVRRPAIYELLTERTIGDLIELAGGLLPTADSTSVQLERIGARGLRSIETLDVETPEDIEMTVQSGDLISVLPVLEELDDAVSLIGHTTRPGSYEWSAGMRLTDLVTSERMLKPKVDLGYVLIRREKGPDRQISVLSADLGAALAKPESEANAPLHVRDQVYIFELGVVRTAAIAAILDELEAQATQRSPFRMVKVSGEVRSPGNYPLETGMRISDLLRAGGGLSSSAFSAGAELTRYEVDSSGERRTKLIPVDIEGILAGDQAADLMLNSYDYLTIKEIPAWEKQFEIELIGEVRFPGVYPVRRGETLSSVLERAGGLTELAFPEGAVFTRATLRDREAKQLVVLERRLRADIAGLGLRAAADPSGNAQQAMSVGQSLLEQIQTTEPVGRLVIDLEGIIDPESAKDDVALRNGDKLYVPQISQEIMVLGEVQYSTSHLFAEGETRDNYVAKSGGLTSNADAKRVYVVRANGAVQAASSKRWFGSESNRIYPGDTIVVPMDTDRVPSIVQWASITQILYNLAISVAAVNSF